MYKTTKEKAQSYLPKGAVIKSVDVPPSEEGVKGRRIVVVYEFKNQTYRASISTKGRHV